MNTPALIFPHTALLRSMLGELFLFFEPLETLEPAGLGPADDWPALTAAGVTKVLAPAEPPDPAAVKRMQALVRQWEQWVAQSKGSGRLEAMKAGINLPTDDPEGLGAIRQGVREYGKQVEQDEPLPPEVRADLMLHLAHAQDRDAADLEGLLGSVADTEKILGSSMGLDAGDSEPAGFEGALKNLSPVSYSMDQARDIAPRLAAWASLAGRVDLGPGWLATSSPEAAWLLMDRANQRFGKPADCCSPAGAVRIEWPPPKADGEGPQAVEAARLDLPDLGGLKAEQVLELKQRLDADNGLHALRRELVFLLNFLADSKWDVHIYKEAREWGQRISGQLFDLLESRGISAAPSGRRLSLIAFPGLDRRQVISLMTKAQAEDIPPASAWPIQWPAGAWPLVVVW